MGCEVYMDMTCSTDKNREISLLVSQIFWKLYCNCQMLIYGLIFKMYSCRESIEITLLEH